MKKARGDIPSGFEAHDRRLAYKIAVLRVRHEGRHQYLHLIYLHYDYSSTHSFLLRRIFKHINADRKLEVHRKFEV